MTLFQHPSQFELETRVQPFSSPAFTFVHNGHGLVHRTFALAGDIQSITERADKLINNANTLLLADERYVNQLWQDACHNFKKGNFR